MTSMEWISSQTRMMGSGVASGTKGVIIGGVHLKCVKSFLKPELGEIQLPPMARPRTFFRESASNLVSMPGADVRRSQLLGGASGTVSILFWGPPRLVTWFAQKLGSMTATTPAARYPTSGSPAVDTLGTGDFTTEWAIAAAI